MRSNRFSQLFLNSILIFSLALAGLLSRAEVVRAAPTELFFSEYIEGSSNNKALEIYNGTGALIDLGAGGYNVQMAFNGNPTPTLTINLSGTVADGDVFVLAQSSANATILAQADQTNGAGWFNGNDAVILRKGTTIIDVIGQIGFDPGTEWGTGLTSTADNTLRRKASVQTGDTDGSNVFDPSIEWDGFATDTFDGLGAHSLVDGVTLSINDVSADEGDSGTISFDFTVSLSSPAPAGGVTFDISTADDTATTADNDYVVNSLTGQTIPEGSSSFTFSVLVNGDTVVEPDETFFVNVMNVVGASVSDGQGLGTIVDDDTDVCALDFTPIYDIQGSGLSAAITGNVTTQGVVVGDYEGTIGLQGFYLQDAAGDGDATTSDGIFVFTGSANLVSAGDVVRVTGFARERFNQTALNGSNSNTSPVTDITSCGTGSVAPVDVEMPFPDSTYLERFEGMLVRFPQDLVISEYFNYDRFGEMVLALPLEGETRHFTPTAVVEPGAPAQERLQEYLLRRITLDDGLGIQNPAFTRHPNGDAFSLMNRFRGGDTVTNTVGVLGFDFSLYRIQPTGPADYTVVNPRPDEPEDVSGSLKVASFNVLNYFTTLDDGVNDICGPLQDQECRGADDQEEFERQRAKIIAALVAMDADVVGLIEIENHPGDVPTADLVSGLNDALGAGTYDYIATGAIGTDAIRLALIYKPTIVAPVGAYEILDTSVDPRFLDEFNRPVLAQTFREHSTGGVFTVAVNHLKSKGSDCNAVGDPDTGDGQGNCNLTRKAAAEAMVDWLASDPTGSGDADFLIIGDLNSYDKEDPIDVLLAGGYTDLIFDYLGEFAYSFVFDGQAGYLDHALANQNLAGQVTGATIWNINADEPDLIDYDTSFKSPEQDAIFAPDAYRSSDHDPVIVGLDLNGSPSCIAAAPSLASLWPANHSFVNINILGITDPEGDPITVNIDSIFQDEAVNAPDSGNTAPDGQGLGTATAQVRAERVGIGNGRVYHISFTASDDQGGSCSGVVLVSAPISQNGTPAVDDGPLFDSTVVP